jgi:hypothetical protein
MLSMIRSGEVMLAILEEISTIETKYQEIMHTL